MTHSLRMNGISNNALTGVRRQNRPIAHRQNKYHRYQTAFALAAYLTRLILFFPSARTSLRVASRAASVIPRRAHFAPAPSGAFFVSLSASAQTRAFFS